MPLSGGSRCRFVLSNVEERIVSSDIGYDVFEPTIFLEIDGSNVFQILGIAGVEKTVIMHSLENFLSESGKLVKSYGIDQKSQHNFRLLGTGFGFKLQRTGARALISIEVNGRWGPVQGVLNPLSQEVATVTVKDWIGAIERLGSELMQVFKKYNEEVYLKLTKLQAQINALRDWLAFSN